MGVEEVRRRLLLGAFALLHKHMVEDWLRQQEVKAENSHKEKDWKLSRKLYWLTWIGIGLSTALSIVAIIISIKK